MGYFSDLVEDGQRNPSAGLEKAVSRRTQFPPRRACAPRGQPCPHILRSKFDEPGALAAKASFLKGLRILPVWVPTRGSVLNSTPKARQSQAKASLIGCASAYPPQQLKHYNAEVYQRVQSTLATRAQKRNPSEHSISSKRSGNWRAAPADRSTARGKPRSWAVDNNPPLSAFLLALESNRG